MEGSDAFSMCPSLFNHREQHTFGALCFAQTPEEAAAALSQFAKGEDTRM